MYGVSSRITRATLRNPVSEGKERGDWRKREGYSFSLQSSQGIFYQVKSLFLVDLQNDIFQVIIKSVFFLVNFPSATVEINRLKLKQFSITADQA